MSVLTGLIPPICTPLHADGSVDVQSLHDLVEFQISAGAQGIFVLGSSGEAIYLDDDDRRKAASAAKAAVGDRVPLLIGALAPTTRRVVQQFSVFAGVDADAFVATAPYYAQPSSTEIATHFEQIAAASPAPVLAYDIPGNVGYKLPTDVAVQLLRDGVVAALKDSSGDVEEFAVVVDRLGADRVGSLLSGADTSALRALEAGADGLIPGLSNIRPDLFVDLLHAFQAHDDAKAQAIQNAIVTLNGIFRIGASFGLGRHASEIGALKHVLTSRGVITSATSPNPLEAFPPAAQEAASALMADVDRQLAGDLAVPTQSGAAHG